MKSEVQSGGIAFSDQGSISPENSDQNSERTPPKSTPNQPPRRGKAREYSEAFETAWRAYGRKEEKLKAYGQWLVESRLAGGETLILPQILTALRWQSELWSPEGWKFAPYFERYLKRRKWEDEPPPQSRPKQAIPFAVSAEESRRERSVQDQIDRLEAESRKTVVPPDPRLPARGAR